MLVLTRRLDEAIVIEGGIHITVLAVKEGQVRLGITAPADVRVDRQEVHARRAPAGGSRYPFGAVPTRVEGPT